ncbi:hypothetical protein BA917_08645 [Helicobacter pullorum]|uniref:BspA family leucine-rich repeat surface protein n=1 Tax=Helicobacter pullorum TaxID=35818 RepID=UPI0008168FA4|nr:BspA family leucine-rich repeat surface protein [Helicobacter pullorum]OCR18407.1 hypothetical protein BA917_08645 [Helicobacter pullorum]
MKYKPTSKKELKDLVNDLSINLGDIDTSKITDMSWLFLYTPRTDFSGIEKWDVSKVENMYGMFEGAESFNADISKWDVSNVENMEDMFRKAESFNQDISKWNVSNVENMIGMFDCAKSFNQDIGDWDVSNVRDIHSMFLGAKAFNQDLSSWDISGVEYIDDETKDLICNNHTNIRTMR